MSRGIWVSETEFRAFAAAEATGMTGHIATRMRAGDLSGFFGLLPNPDPVLRRLGQSIEVYRDLIVDPLVKSGLRRRRAAVMSMDRGFEQGKAGARMVRNCEALFADLPIKNLVRSMVDGAYYGYAVAEIVWGTVGALTVPVDVVPKPAEWFGFDSGTGELRFKPLGSLNGEAVPPRKFVVVGSGRSYLNPYGEPDAASCFWPVTLIRGGKRFWATFAEKYGTGFLIGKLPRNAGQVATDQLAAQLEQMVRDAVAVIPDDGSVEHVNVGTTANADMYEQLLMYCGREINIALLGNNQTTELASNKASATAGAGVEDELRDDHAEICADGLNQLVRYICEVNWPGQQPPLYEFVAKGGARQELAQRDKTLHDAGVRLTASYYKRAYDLQDDDIADVDAGGGAPAAPGAPSVQPRGAATRAAAAAQDDVADGVALAEDSVPPDQAAIDAAVDAMPVDAMQAAMATMLRPALDAVLAAQTPDEAITALAEAYPKLDSTALESLLTQAFFVADVVGRAGVREEAGDGQ